MKNNRSIFLCIITMFSVFEACRQTPSYKNELSEIPSHESWNTLLEKYVDDKGTVDYKGFIKDSSQLNLYLQELATNTPNDSWKYNNQLAYWINIYNAATIQLITKHYPITSIKDIGSSIQISFVNTPWQIEFININGELVDLDHIEHGIIRKEFDEPRIHFALVCAAVSCPKLRNEAYLGASLDQQLSDQAHDFLMDKRKNNIAKDHIVISKLFRWYGGDFKKETTLIEYLNQYSTTLIDTEADIDYMDYDWELNEQ